MKRGQITIYIIIGMVILVIISAVFYMRTRVAEEVIEEEVIEEEVLITEAQAVNVFVESCIDDTLEDGILFVSSHGGYYRVPELSDYYSFIKIPFYFYVGEELIPDKAQIENSLAEYVQDNLVRCIDGFSAFPWEVVSEGDISVGVQIFENEVLARVIYPVEIRAEDKLIEVSEFNIAYETNYQEALEIINEIVAKQREDKNVVMTSYILDLAFYNDFLFNLIYEEDIVFYILSFNDIRIKRNPLVFNFAAKYNWSTEQDKRVVDILPIPRQNTTEGQEFTFQLETVGENLEFISLAENVEISPGGLLSFTPTNENIGVNYLLIGARSNLGEDYEILIIDVENINDPPVIEQLAVQESVVGEEKIIQVVATDPDLDKLYYLDNTDLFNINFDTGKIVFTPNPVDVGTHKINITVVDRYGLSDSIVFDLVIG
jgi:hypothetical protein